MFYTTEQISEHISKTPEGFLLCSDVPIARIGDYEYSKDEVPIESNGKMVIIHRDEDEVFSPTAIMSFNGKPITINHPSDFVTPENWNEYAHGTVQNVRRGEGEQEDLLLADLIINTEKAINLVENGLREISCGYDATYEDEGNGEGRQRNIVGNHVALVLQGRAGNRCSIQDGCSCNGCGKCKNKTEVKIGMKAKDLFKKLFPKSRFADALSEEDLGEVNEGAVGGAEEAIQAAAEAKEAAAEAVEAAKKADEIAQSIEEKSTAGAGGEGGVETDEEGAPDLKAVVERLDRLESLIMKYFGEGESTDSEEKEEVKDKKIKDRSYREIEKELNDLEEKRDIWEEKEEFGAVKEANARIKKLEEELKTADEGFQNVGGEEEKEDEELAKEFQDVAANATIIDPSIVINKPSKKFKDFYTTLKKTALKKGLTGDCGKEVKAMLKGRTVDSLKRAELDAIFESTAHVVAITRDSRIKVKKPVIKKEKSTVDQISDINKRNKEFWNR